MVEEERKMSNMRSSEEKETGRLEAFSDGIFAFAITLLVLGLRDPVQAAGQSETLLSGLFTQWPAFFAYFTSFLSVLVIWVNHHNMFSYIRRINTRFLFLNGFLLLTVTLNPFTTSLVADHLLDNNSKTAAGVYSGVFFLLSVAWKVLWRYASKEHRLLSRVVTNQDTKRLDRDFNLGVLLYVLALALAFVSGLASFVAVLASAVFWATTASTRTLVGADSEKRKPDSLV
jgi:TMEM175 potassium channel family protein